eukprot:scaffold30156_cov65-Phaeocystis_antarctica.AAC.5
MLPECSLSSVQYLDSSSMATAERVIRAKHRMPSPFLVPISTASVFRRSSATALCTACGERIGGQSTGFTIDAQSIGSERAASIARRQRVVRLLPRSGASREIPVLRARPRQTRRRSTSTRALHAHVRAIEYVLARATKSSAGHASPGALADAEPDAEPDAGARRVSSRRALLPPPNITTMATAASSASITVTYKTLPSATQANVWLRWPYLVVCTGALVQVYDAHTPAEGSSSAGDEAGSAGDSFLQCVHQFSLGRYHVGAASSGRGVNVLHGLDVRDGCLVGGTASGLVLHVVLPPSGGSLPTPSAGAEPTIRELPGHTKVVGFVQLAHAPDDDLAYTSSLDRTVRGPHRAAASGA